MLIGTTATVGLLLVGVLALSMTPDRLGSPEDTRISTSNVVADPGSESASGVPVGAPQSLADSVLRAVSTLLTSTSVSGNDVPAPNPLVPAPTATDPPPITTRATEATEPVAITDLPTETTQPPQPSNPAVSAPPVTTGPSASGAAAFTTQVDGAPEPTSDAALVLPGADELALTGPGSATSSTTPGQPTTSTSSSSTSSSSTSTSTSTTSSTTTEPASSTTLGFAAKQLSNDD